MGLASPHPAAWGGRLGSAPEAAVVEWTCGSFWRRRPVAYCPDQIVVSAGAPDCACARPASVRGASSGARRGQTSLRDGPPAPGRTMPDGGSPWRTPMAERSISVGSRNSQTSTVLRAPGPRSVPPPQLRADMREGRRRAPRPPPPELPGLRREARKRRAWAWAAIPAVAAQPGATGRLSIRRVAPSQAAASRRAGLASGPGSSGASVSPSRTSR